MAVNVVLGNSGNTLSITQFDTIVGGTGSDIVTVTGVVSGSTVDLAGGTDVLTLADGAHFLTVSNVETLTGGGGGHTSTPRRTTPATGVHLRGPGCTHAPR